MLIHMYDSTNPAGIPANPQAVAGYVDGSWDDYEAMVERFPDAIHVSITATGVSGARVVDCEKGDLTPEGAAAWCRSEIAAKRRPTVYVSASAKSAVEQALQALQIPLSGVDWWDANWGTGDHIDTGDVGTQWLSAGGFDESTVQEAWADPAAPVTPPPPPQTPTPAGGTRTQTVTYTSGDDNVQIIDVNVGPLDSNGNGWTDVTLPTGKTKENCLAPAIDEADPTTQGYVDKGATIEPDYQVPYPASPNIVRYVLTGFPPNTGLITFRVPVA